MLFAQCSGTPFGVNFTIFKWDCKGQPPFAGVRGVPEKPLFLLLLAAAGGEEGGKEAWGHPKPRQGGPCTPSVDAKEWYPLRVPGHLRTNGSRYNAISDLNGQPIAWFCLLDTVDDCMIGLAAHDSVPTSDSQQWTE